MTTATGRGPTLAALARCAAAATAFALLPTAAGAFTLINDIVARLTYNLYDQTDIAMLIPCYQEHLDNKGERTFNGFPESCAGRIKLRVKVDIGSVNCLGLELTPNSTARITGTTSSCSVTVTP